MEDIELRKFCAEKALDKTDGDDPHFPEKITPEKPDPKKREEEFDGILKQKTGSKKERPLTPNQQAVYDTVKKIRAAGDFCRMGMVAQAARVNNGSVSYILETLEKRGLLCVLRHSYNNIEIRMAGEPDAQPSPPSRTHWRKGKTKEQGSLATAPLEESVTTIDENGVRRTKCPDRFATGYGLKKGQI